MLIFSEIFGGSFTNPGSGTQYWETGNMGGDKEGSWKGGPIPP